MINQRLFKVTSVALVLVASGHSVWAANGSGYNGPTFNTISIPETLERGITMNQLSAAVETCLSTGDRKRGVVSLSERILQQLGGELPVYSSFGRDTFRLEVEKEAENFLASGNGAYTLPAKNAFACEFQNGLAQDCSVQMSSFFYGRTENLGLVSEFVVSINRPGDSTLELVTHDLFVAPVLRYDQMTLDATYDDLGREAQGKVMKGIQIIVPSDLDTRGTAAVLYNRDTGKATKVTVNFKEYVECLKGEIQAQATQR